MKKNSVLILSLLMIFLSSCSSNKSLFIKQLSNKEVETLKKVNVQASGYLSLPKEIDKDINNIVISVVHIVNDKEVSKEEIFKYDKEYLKDKKNDLFMSVGYNYPFIEKGDTVTMCVNEEGSIMNPITFKSQTSKRENKSLYTKIFSGTLKPKKNDKIVALATIIGESIKKSNLEYDELLEQKEVFAYIVEFN